MAYQAEIKVGVRGLKRVQELQSALNKVNIKINAINKVESAKASAGQKQKLTSVEKNLKIETQAAQIQKRALAIKDNILKMDMKGVKVSQVKAKLTRAINQAEKGKFINAKRNVAVAEKELQILKAQTVERGKQAQATGKNTFQFPMGKSSPLRFSDQGQLLPGSSRRFDRQSALISGGFPLLFGQGPLTAAAGALGGGFGGMLGGQMGGFAGGIAATAAVQAISTALGEISKLGQAMGAFTQDIQAMTTAMGLQGSAQEAQLKRIERTQGKTAAFNASMKMMENRIGTEGVRKIKEFGETTRILGQQFSTALLRLQAFMGGMANFIARLLAGEKKLKDAEINQAVADAAAGGNEEAKALLAREKEIAETGFKTTQTSVRSTSKRTVALPGTKDKLAELKRDKEIFAVRNKISLANDEITSKSQSLVEEKTKEFDLNKRIKEEMANGTNKELATSLAKLNQIFDEEQKILEQKALQAEEDLRKAIANKEDLDTQKLLKDEFIAHTLELGKHNELREKGVKLTKDLHDQTDLVREAFESLSESINNDIKEGIKGLIKGTSTLGDMLNNIADKFLDLALNQALFGSILGSKGKPGGGILGAIGLFANGGMPPVGKPSIVGEKGPELFVPRSSGTIVPNNKLGGGGSTSVVVNVDASGSDVQGDDAGGQELGSLIAAAVQGELVKQQRPGGLLNR